MSDGLAHGLRPMTRTQAELDRHHALATIAAIMRKTGHEQFRLRFYDLYDHGLTVWHDPSTDEMVFLLETAVGSDALNPPSTSSSVPSHEPLSDAHKPGRSSQ